ncbi:hypothetical protein GCM10025865_11130 [Paraoerskovia sediminicola]|uniref:ABC-2 type transporter transmembrane domain-containing protein n=1 Tax=Paraoerskovia sediminicola TaxID=1138587 RepID=A0ABM8G112_9CELL|nr:ABC transporter permease [Paraoerskovia sediminicola]BDZ41814.1 hypothetical protein GCM10025865_11130 [Paraoerskovia sediminicola]
MTEILPGADLTTPAGWANAEFLSMVAPGFLIAVAVISGMRATAAEEEAKTLGMSLSAPVSRTTFLAAKSVATVLLVGLMGVMVLVGLWVADLSGDLGLSTSGMVAAALHTTMLGLVVGAVTITAGVLVGRKRPTMVIGAGFAGLSFAIASFFPLSESLSSWARISPWYHYNASDPLVNGADWGSLTVLAITAVVVLAIGFWDFPRKDLRG